MTTIHEGAVSTIDAALASLPTDADRVDAINELMERYCFACGCDYRTSDGPCPCWEDDDDELDAARFVPSPN